MYYVHAACTRVVRVPDFTMLFAGQGVGVTCPFLPRPAVVVGQTRHKECCDDMKFSTAALVHCNRMCLYLFHISVAMHVLQQRGCDR